MNVSENVLINKIISKKWNCVVTKFDKLWSLNL